MATRSRCALGASLFGRAGFGFALACVFGFGFTFGFGGAFFATGFFLGGGLWAAPLRFLGDALVPPALGVRRRPEEVEERDEAIRPPFAGERASPASGRLDQVPPSGHSGSPRI